MNEPHVTISLNGPTGTVAIDGHDITNSVQSLTLNAEAGTLPSLTIDLVMVDVTTISDTSTRIMLTDDTRNALITLGWTPPAADPQV